MTAPATDRVRSSLAALVEEVVATTPVYDIHTHLYDPAFGPLLLWGIDDLLIYHYLVAESFRYLDLPYDKFWALSRARQAEIVWDELFRKRSPVSESCRGVVTTLQALGLDVRRSDLRAIRKWFAGWRVEDYVGRCMELARVERICMTNSPFDDLERPIWERGFRRDSRFAAALRLDPLVLTWPQVLKPMRAAGYEVRRDLSGKSFLEVRRFLSDWTQRIDPLYLMISLPPDFVYPGRADGARLIEKAVLPFCAEHGLPFAVMPGVKRGVNPGLRLAGDGMALTRMETLESLCALNPDNRFLATVLARVDQHALCVLARKFRNLHVFGCWWFTNVASIIEEMTRMRVELLGLSVTLQHSDARVMDQVIYKWRHSRAVIARVLAEKYQDLADSGWKPSRTEIERDVRAVFGGEFLRFCGQGAN